MKSVTITAAVTLILFFMASFSNHDKLNVTSPAFRNNGIIPARFSCEGNEASPPLHIDNVPAGAVALALIVHDPDAPKKGGFTHWVMWNLPVDGTIPENFKGAEQGYNGGNQPGYKGMCPPSGTHHYNFIAYALDTKLTLPAQTDKDGLEKAIKGHIVAQGQLTGLFSKSN